MSVISSLRFSILGQTHSGLVRHYNEDDYRICYDLNAGYWGHSPSEGYSLSDHGAIIILADGMGGLDAGEIASRTAVEQIKMEFESLTDIDILSSDDIKKKLKGSFVKANNAIENLVQESISSNANMGTTLIVCWIHKEMLYVAWTGDSRAYLYNKNEIIHRFPIDYKSCGNKFRVITDDHSLVWNRVVETKGKFTKEDARISGQSNVILKCIGYHFQSEDVDIIGPVNLHKDDKILVCSDGLNSMLSDEELLKVIEQSAFNEDLVSELISKANAAGGRDNITVALCEILSQKSNIDTNENTNLKVVKRKKVNIFYTISNLLAFGLLIVLGIKLYKNFRNIDRNVIVSEKVEEYNDSLDKRKDTGDLKILNKIDHLSIEVQQSSPEIKSETNAPTPETIKESIDNNTQVNNPAPIISNNKSDNITLIGDKKDAALVSKFDAKLKEVLLANNCETFNTCKVASCQVIRIKVKEKFYYNSEDKSNFFKNRTLCNESKLKENLLDPNYEGKLTIKFKKKCGELGNNNIEIIAISVSAVESIFK